MSEDKTGTEELRIIFEILSQVDILKGQAQKLGDKFVEKYSIFKKGMRIEFEEYKNRYFGIIERVDFDENSDIDGYAALHIRPTTKQFLPPKGRRNNKFTKGGGQFKLIKIYE